MARYAIGTTRAVPRYVGVEHEYAVSVAGSPIDFRERIHDLPTFGRRIDPGDLHAYRMASGLKITCDGPEAEIATPPIALDDGCVDELIVWTGFGGRCLLGLLDDSYDVEGVSTHISVALDNGLVSRASGMFARTFAPALMLLMDAESSPGLLVRPRYGRLELGGEFVAGEQLAAALALTVGGALVCERAAASFRAKAALPPPIRVDVVRSVDRYGWYVARDAFGTDLYATGRDTMLRREMVGTIRAQDCLEAAWESARRALHSLVHVDDLRAADDAVSGTLELPLESGLRSAPPESQRTPEPPAVGRAMSGVETPSLVLSPAAATWDYVVFTVHGAREVFVAVPRADLIAFVDDARDGRHDGRLAAFIEAPDGGRRLTTFDDAVTFGVWDALDFSAALAPPERGADGIERPLVAEFARRSDVGSVTGEASERRERHGERSNEPDRRS